MSSAPDPGIHHDIPFEDYLAWDAVSNSRLGLLESSPLHYQAGFSGENSRSLRLGSLVHCGVLEPKALDDRYAALPAFHLDPRNHTISKKKGSETKERSWSAGTKWVKAQQEAWRDKNQGKEEIPEDFLAQLKGMAAQICETPSALDCFESGEAEVSIVWFDRTWGLKCKARVDWFDPERSRFADFKTCREVLRFPWSIQDWGYDRQVAFYSAGLLELTGEIFEPHLIASETKSPFACMSAPCGRVMLKEGARKVGELMDRLSACLEADFWPGPESPDFWGADAPEVSAGSVVSGGVLLEELSVGE